MLMCRVESRDGTVVWLDHRCRLVTRIDDKSMTLEGIARDVTTNKALEDRLHHQACHDPLTGLPNRAYFIDDLETALSSLDDRPGTLALFFLDLDRFKLVNDGLGHSAGDQMLCIVAERLCNVVRGKGNIARIGGDEFCLYVDGLNDAATVTKVAERIQKTLAEPIAIGPTTITAPASIGVATANDSTTNAETLLAAADAAMYRAKELGKGRIEVFDRRMRTAARKKLELQHELRSAIVRSIVDLGHDLRLEVVAGGVETAEQLSALRAFGCDTAQSYFVSRPKPASHWNDKILLSRSTGVEKSERRRLAAISAA